MSVPFVCVKGGRIAPPPRDEDLPEMMGVILLIYTLLRVSALDHPPHAATAGQKLRQSGPDGAGP